MRMKRDQLSLVIVMSFLSNNYYYCYYYLVDFVLYADAATADLDIRSKL